MKSDFKVATSAVFALLATVATVEIGGHRGAGPTCLRNASSTIQTRICAQKSAGNVRIGARKSVAVSASAQSASLQLGRLDLTRTSAVRPIRKSN